MKLYFKGLDTLRAIAAIVVVISHIELIKSNGTRYSLETTFYEL